MKLISCNSRCMLARKCGTHVINRPDPKVRDQEIKKFQPELKYKCPGFSDVKDTDTDS